MRIEVLGPVRLRTEAGVQVEVAERQLRLLLVSLVTADGDPVPADYLIDRLWGEELPANPKKVLRAKLSRLRTLLDRAQPAARDLLHHTPAGYRLAVAAEAVDAGRFKKAVERATRKDDVSLTVQTLPAALRLWRGEPFGDIGDEVWLAPAIAELKDLRAAALERLAEAFLERGSPEQALTLLPDAAEEYPARERLTEAMMLGLYQTGRQSEALGVFERLRLRLADDLGIDPSPRIRELHAQILRQEPSLTAPLPSARSAPISARRTNIPAEAAPVIGRRRESEQIAALLDEGRLVTVTGIGGVGKTRLAVHCAREREARLERGVWFVDLSELTGTRRDQPVSAGRIAHLSLSALDLVRRDVARIDVDQLCEALGSKSTLLVLDNCEHVLAEAAEFVTVLLRRTPAVQVLATSREPLGLPHEQRYDLRPLDTEASGGSALSEAVQFFEARARVADPSFRLDGTTLPAVTELCRRLDGLPLALELAAVRIRGISVEDLLERLSDRLNLLRRPGRGVPRRQQTLRGMIDWSWSLLDGPQQAVLRRLSVHPGSLTLDAAESICSDEAGDANPAGVTSTQVVDALMDLVDRSMVITVPTAAGMRYTLLESIAAYAAERLDEAGERHAVARRHLDYYLGLAHRADRHLRGPRQRQWLVRLEAERLQLRNAFDEAVRNEDGGSAVALAVADFWYQWIVGCHGNLSDELRIAIALPGPRDDRHAAAATLSACLHLESGSEDEVRLVEDALGGFSDRAARAHVQWFAGSALLSVGVREAGERHVEEASRVLSEIGEEWDLAVAASQRDWFLVSVWAETPKGLPDGREPEQVLQEIEEGWGLVQALGIRYRVAETHGDHRRAARAAQRAAGAALESGLWAEASYWLSAFAIAALRAGDVPSARERLARARKCAVDTAYAFGEVHADLAASMIARYGDDLDEAKALLERWVAEGGLGASRDPNTHVERGFLAVQQGEVSGAEGALRTLASLIPRDVETPMSAHALELAAAILATRGDAVGASEMLGAAAAVRARTGLEASVPSRRDIDRVRATVAEHLTPEQAAEAHTRGGETDSALQRALALVP